MIENLQLILKNLALDTYPLKTVQVNNVTSNKMLIDIKSIIADIYHNIPLCHVEILHKTDLYISSSLSRN